MKRVALKTYGKIVAFLLSIVGFLNGCDIIGGGAIAEYGTPSADFVVKGKVVDKQTKKPIKNMAVIHKSDTSPYGNDTVRTNSEGNYVLKFNKMAFQAENSTVYTSDLDGFDNGGEFESDTIRIPASEFRQIKKSKGWNQGTFEKTNADFTLSYKTEAMYGVPTAEYKETEKSKE